MLVAIGAIGSKIFDDYSRSDLKQYCRQRGNIEFFNLVRDRYQNISLASETLVAIAGSVAVVSLALTVIAHSATGVEQAQRGMIQGLLEVGLPDGNGEFVSAQVWTSVVTIAISLLLLGVWLPRALVSVWSSHIIYHTWTFWISITRLMTPFTLGVRLVGGLALSLIHISEPTRPY